MSDRDFHYRVGWRAVGVRPGAHGGRSGGGDSAPRHSVPYITDPNPRLLDLRATLADPFQVLKVRPREQRTAIKVVAVLDLSASMACAGRRAKHLIAADFLDALALSVHRTGDALGVVACGEGPQPEWTLPVTRQWSAARELANRLRLYPPAASSARGLLQVGRFLPATRSLVFLLSDFHYPLAQIRQILASLSPHDLAPVILWDPDEKTPPSGGLARLYDAENGEERLLWLRPKLRERLNRSVEDRRERLQSLFRQFGRTPIVLDGTFDPDRISRHFLSIA